MRRVLFAFLGLAACTGRSEHRVEPVVRTDVLAHVRASDPSFARFGREWVSDRAIDVALPQRSNGEARIALDAARSLTVRPLDVASVAEQRVEHASVFASAAPSTDLLLAREADRFEEVRVMHDERAPATVRWALGVGDGIATLRIDYGAVEALDRNGRVVLRSDRIFAVDAKGVRREPSLSLEKRESGWILEATLDRAGLSFPIVLDPVWLPGGAMAAGRVHASAVRTADGKVYVACGSTSAFEVFDPSTSSFKSLKALETYVAECGMWSTADGKIRVISKNPVTAYTYTIATDTWVRGADGIAADGGPSDGAEAVELSDGKVLFVGGIGSPASSITSVYDPSTDAWTAKATLVTGRSDHAAVLLKSGKVLVAGGQGNSKLSSTEIYDPSANTWTAGPSLPTALARLKALRLADGRVLFAGGIDDAITYSDKTFVYDPTAGTITAGPTLTKGRESIAIVATKDGRVLTIGGGFNGEGATDAVEVFPDTIATMAVGPKLPQPRAYAPAIELLDGRILLVGGNTGTFFSTVSTDLLSAFANGAACTWGGECASGFCASGVCCDKACTGECERCALPGKEGTCSPAPLTTECGAAASCTGSKFASRGHCSGTDTTCAAGASGDCAGGLVCADATSCLSKCTKDADCTTAHCDTASGLCLPPVADSGAPAPVAPAPEGSPKVLGSAQRCTNPSECATGFCVDGVCCDSACTDRCHSCALPSSPGRCAEEPIGVDLRAECGAALSCSGTCGKGGNCTTSVAGSQCQPSTCTGPTTGKGAAVCVATGGPCGVEAAVAFECGAYVCDPAFGACRTSCTSSDACAPGFTCNTDKKLCERLPEDQDTGCAMGGHESGTGAALIALAIALSASRGFRRRGR